MHPAPHPRRGSIVAAWVAGCAIVTAVTPPRASAQAEALVPTAAGALDVERQDALASAHRHVRRERIGFFVSVGSVPVIAGGLALVLGHVFTDYADLGRDPTRGERAAYGTGLALTSLGGAGFLGGHLFGVANGLHLGHDLGVLGERRLRWGPITALCTLGMGFLAPTAIIPMAVHVRRARRTLASLGARSAPVDLTLVPHVDRDRRAFGLTVYAAF